VHVVCLAHGHQDRALRSHVVERWKEMVHGENADLAPGVANVHRQIAILLDYRQRVRNRPLPPIDLAILQRGSCGAGVGHGEPFDPVDQDPLAAGEP
jgi:hypothetical protein